MVVRSEAGPNARLSRRQRRKRHIIPISSHITDAKFRRARAESSQIDGRALGRGDDLAICADLERDMIADTCGNNCSRSLSPPLYFVRTHAGNDLRECGLSFFADNGAWLAL